MTDKKLWGGRFSKATAALMDQYNASIQFDHELVYEDILGSIAHANMLAGCHLITSVEAEQIVQGLRNLAHQCRQGKLKFSLQDEDIHMNVERLLTQAIGAAAEKLHTARSRNDQVALDLHLYVRKQIVATVACLIQLQEVLIKLASEHKTVIMPGYTHLQRAQPIYFAQHLLAYFASFTRDIVRLCEIYQRVNISPLGAGALNGSTLAIDRHKVAQQLGLEHIYLNNLDAVSNRDFILEYVAACSLIMQHVSRLSEEIILWSSQEFNFIELDDAYCTGSSMMPQKKNPDVAELARGKTGRVYGALMSLLTVLKGLPFAYNKDLQEDKEALFDVVKTVQTTLQIYAPLLETMKINADKMLHAATAHYANATALADYLVQKGLSFRSAHEVVGKLVAEAIKLEKNLEALPLKLLQAQCAVIGEDVYAYLQVENIVRACDQGNNRGESYLSLQFLQGMQELQQHQQWLLEKQKLLDSVYAILQ
jgi:argininosuccinate lyase